MTDHRSMVRAPAPWPAESAVRISAVRTFLVAPEGRPLCIVRVETSEPGLYGLGCASDPQRVLVIPAIVERYLEPLLVGRDPADVVDLHALMTHSGYWRGGSPVSAAIGGIDTALWDLKAKSMGAPLHSVWGGRVRAGATVYGHAHGSEIAAVVEEAQSFVERGYTAVRCQVAMPGKDTYGAGSHAPDSDDLRRVPWDYRGYVDRVQGLLESVRGAVGSGVDLLHDVHERLPVPEARRLLTRLAPVAPLFVEDPIGPEDVGWLAQLRAEAAVPIALGELFAGPEPFVPLIGNRLIDFARIRVAAVGGVTPTLRLLAMCELHGVRSALHGPPDVSPIGHAVSASLGVASRAFGIQESWEFDERTESVFPGMLRVQAGRLSPGSRPGHGVDFDESAAAAFPVGDAAGFAAWALLRGPDGFVTRP